MHVMHRSDYTQEVGLKMNCQTVSKPVAIAVLALAAAGLWLGARQVLSGGESHQTSEPVGTAAQTAAHLPVANK
jgi:hypothetical protein